MGIRTLTALLALALLLAGCGGGSTGTPAPAAGSSDGGTTAAAPIGKGDVPACPATEPTEPVLEANKTYYDNINSLPDNNGAGVSQGPWNVKVVGDTSLGHALKIKASGFQPDGCYRTRVITPAGVEYDYYVREGRFDKHGGMPWWEWDPNVTNTGKADPPGTYKLKITDVTPGSRYKDVSIDLEFIIKEPKK